MSKKALQNCGIAAVKAAAGQLPPSRINTWRITATPSITAPPTTAGTLTRSRWFRSKAALDALRSMEEHHRSGEGGGRGSVVLYLYPCLSATYAALFARLFHARLRLPVLLLPFSSVAPLRECDFKLDFIQACYLLGFIGPDDFAVHLSQFIPKVIAFDHRQSTLKRVSKWKFCRENLEFYVHADKSSTVTAYDYFSNELLSQEVMGSPGSLIDSEYKDRVMNMLRYIENADLRKWNIPDIRAFTIGVREECLNLNCITNPYIFDQLLKLDPADLTQKGDRYTCSRQEKASTMLSKSFKILLGRGFYGECLCIRADELSELSHEIGSELSKLSGATGLRPIGAVVFMQRGRMKVCLRSTSNAVDTSEIAKAYGGGGKPHSSSFVIPMDEYNRWISGSS